jgi:hypothetical protein
MAVRFHALALAVVLTIPATGAERALLWRAPGDIRSRDLYYGIGGRDHAPRGPFKFLKEDLDGSNPKYTVKDRDGIKWKLKLGIEARSETAASRIIWAAGYYTSEDYYLPKIQVEGIPAKLHRGKQWIDPDGTTMYGARLKREPDGAEKLGTWKWTSNPFIGTREFNGLRTLMGVINNWDLKDENNAVYREHGDDVFIVSDLGAAFGSPGLAWPTRLSRDNLDQYRTAKFICRTSPDDVNFCAPGREALVRLVNPKRFLYRWRLRRIGHDIPRTDARWMGEILAHLSSSQIRDAFRASGYSPEEIERFARLLERRIGELSEL